MELSFTLTDLIIIFFIISINTSLRKFLKLGIQAFEKYLNNNNDT